MACEQCGSGNISSFGMRTEHIFCHACGAHKYEGQLITRKAWDAWVNGEAERPARDTEAKAVPA